MGKIKYKIIIAIIIIFVVIVGCYISCGYWKDKYISETANSDEINYQNANNLNDLIQYKIDSINDDEGLNKILENTELSKYIVKTEKYLKNEKEYLIIYYSDTIKNKTEQQWFNNSKGCIIQKNAILLFTLVNNLEKITYIDSFKFEEYHKLGINYIEGISEEYDRKRIDEYFNQDVRDYINKPNEFMKYNIDTNIKNITIHVRSKYIEEKESWEYKEIEVTEKEKVNRIKDLIENYNFGIQDGSINTLPSIWVDLHNGYIIEMYRGISDLGRIFKGTIKEAIETYALTSTAIPKTLPTGLQEYIINIINISE